MDTAHLEPQVAPAMHFGAQVPVGREDLRERGAGPPTVWAHYFYDAAGTRLKKIVSKVGGGGIKREVTVYIDGVYEETYVTNGGTLDPNKHYNTLHVMDGRSRIATLRVGTDTDDSTPAVKYNIEDHLGTSSVMLAKNGALVNREEYYPFGDSCFGAFAKKRYRYVGKEKDNESGLYYYGARYYAPWTYRFVSVDPLAANYPHYTPYQYAGNKPINFIDLDGLEENDPNAGSSPNSSAPKQTADDRHEDGEPRMDNGVWQCGQVWQCSSYDKSGNLSKSGGWVKLGDWKPVDAVKLVLSKEGRENAEAREASGGVDAASIALPLTTGGRTLNPWAVAGGAALTGLLLKEQYDAIPHPDLSWPFERITLDRPTPPIAGTKTDAPPIAVPIDIAPSLPRDKADGGLYIYRNMKP